MVYCGKPSKACGECRVRRTKCDYLKPNCSQCIRMGRVCSGYRNPVDTMFRNESKSFGAKHPRTNITKNAASPTVRLSSQELDQALAAPFIAFLGTPTCISNQRYGSPLSLESDLAKRDQDLFFADDVLDQHMCDVGSAPKMPHTSVGEFRDASIENLASLGTIVGPSESWSASEVMISTQMKYNMPFVDQFCFGSGTSNDFVTTGLSPECSNDSGSKSSHEMDMFDFDCFAGAEISRAYPLRTLDPTYFNQSPVAGISDSNEMQALCYFFANYVLENTKLSEGYLDYLPSLCISETGSSFLMDTIISLGLAGLGMRKHDQNALNSAHLKYASALRQLNTALTSKAEALSDQALITVFLMGLYETNTCSTPHNIRAWTNHIWGAITMLQLRGKTQLESPVGLQIFLQWRGQIITHCHHRRIPIPAFILEWSRGLLEHETPVETMATTLCLVTSKVCTLRADMKSFRNYSKSSSAVPRAIEIDADLEQWAEDYPVAYERRTATSIEQSNFMLGDYFDVYNSATEATVWNDYRRMRILCHEIILQHLMHIQQHRVDYPDFKTTNQEIETQLHISKSLLEKLSQDICASVPFYFGIHTNSGGLKPGALAPKAVCGNLLLRPLYMAAEPTFVSNEVKKWVIERFEKIAEVMGVKQATAMGHLLSIGIDPDEWEDTIQD